LAVNDNSNVTVIIPTITGRDHLLGRALLSAWQQTRPPHEIIIVHDLDRCGAAAARNYGTALVTTEWIAWLDDDDLLYPEHLAVLQRGAQWSGADLVYSYAKFAGGSDPLACPDATGSMIVRPFDVPWNPHAERHLREVGNFIPVTYLVRTGLTRAVGGMPEAFSDEWPRDCEDHGFLVRLLDAGARFFHVSAVTWVYHFHGANTGGRGLQATS
jgi:glycosyltransferase involved in cell wall biosynthesis